MERVRSIIVNWREGVEKKLAGSSVELVRADAAFAAPQTLRANGELYEADVVVIDTGGRPVVPPIDGLAGTPYLTSDTFFGQETLPERLIVLGSGYIGLELGQGAARLGSRVDDRHARRPADRPRRTRRVQRADAVAGTRRRARAAAALGVRP